MIILKELSWDNILSYGDNNSIILNKEPLTQLVGKNGSGKTSIPIILQEVLYGKNVKNIKKQSLVNRYTSKKGYSINLTFEKDSYEYQIILDRSSSINLSLFKNGDNISSHTSVNTYKQISDILGIEDFNIFTQLVYQSSTGSLEFLTATDSNRKKFLISLLQLEKYINIYNIFKEKARTLSLTTSRLEGRVESNSQWLLKNKNIDFDTKELIDIPEDLSKEYTDKLTDLKGKLNNLKQLNRKILDNKQYVEELKNLDMSIISKDISLPDDTEYKNIVQELNNLKAKKLEPENLLNKLEKLDNQCPTCMQDIAEEYVNKLDTEANDLINKLDNNIKELLISKKHIEAKKKEWEEVQNTIGKFETLSNLIDNTIETEIINSKDVEEEVLKIERLISDNKNEIIKAIKYNEEVNSHNYKIKVVEDQILELEKELNSLNSELSTLKDEQSIIELLKKVFSTNGLVSYKIESSVKELEKTINRYLSDFGHFQIFFRLEKDKLNIQVLDNLGKETSIQSLSAGELGRVNIATVLAIRSIMSNLSDTKINFLFLDEILGVLDANGKEKLTEILLKENLNTFIVSHEYEHPLVPKLYINKENNISRIEYG